VTFSIDQPKLTPDDMKGLIEVQRNNRVSE
jgi:hypothetical protein